MSHCPESDNPLVHHSILECGGWIQSDQMENDGPGSDTYPKLSSKGYYKPPERLIHHKAATKLSVMLSAESVPGTESVWYIPQFAA